LVFIVALEIQIMNQNIIETYFQKWKDQLIDLSRKNAQIYFNSPRNSLLFHQIDTSNTSQLSHLIQHFIVDEKVFSFWPPNSTH